MQLSTIANTTNQTMTSIELLKIVNEERSKAGESVVRHNVFFARCKDELDGDLYKIFVEPAKTTETGKTPAFEAIEMTQDQCKLVAMRESKSVRRKVLTRLKELEAATAFTLPKTFGEALRLAAEQQEKIEQQQAQLLLAAPKVAYVDTFVDHGANKNITAVAKDLGVSGKKLGLWLRYNKFAFRQKGKMMWYQSFMDSGYGVHKAFNTKTDDKNGTSGTQALLTPKGDVFVKDKYKSKPEVPDCFEEVDIN